MERGPQIGHRNGPRRWKNQPQRVLAVHWHSRILGFYPSALARKPSKFGPGGSYSTPPDPRKPSVFLWRGRRLQSRVGGLGGGPAWAPSGCPGESSKFSILISPLQWTGVRWLASSPSLLGWFCHRLGPFRCPKPSICWTSVDAKAIE